MSDIGWQIGVSIIVLGGFMLAYLLIAGLVGYVNSIKTVCSAGQRAISTDGSRSMTGPAGPSSIITPTQDYPFCSPRLSCPQEGLKWAVHADGSALTNSCDVPNCPCSAFQHCPAYASTIFRQFGADARISLFQVIDPTVKDKTKPQDPYDPPYLLSPLERGDRCFLSSTTINSVWPAIQLGQKCLQGTLAAISTTPANYVCAPTQFVNSNNVFDVDAWMNAYKT